MCEVGLLGPLRVTLDGNPVGTVGPRARGILAILALFAGRPVPSDLLIDRLWGDEPPPSARNTLQTHVTHLRQVLEPGRRPRVAPRLLVTVGDAYLLDVEPAAVDAHRFEAHVRAAARAVTPAARRDEARRALELWRGEPLADVAAAGLVDAERARLHGLHVDARRLHTGALADLGAHDEAIIDAEELVRDHPYDELIWALLIRSLYGAGRPAHALAAYQRARTVLRDDLGLDPSPELRSLEARILAQDPALAEAPAAPPEPPPFACPSPAPGQPSAAGLRIVIAEDHVVVREGLHRLVEARAGVEVVATCATLDELLAAADHHRPDVVLTDIRMPPTFGDEGVQAARSLRTRHPGIGVLVLSQYAEPAYAMAVLGDGAGGRGYLLKESVRNPDQLHEAIHAVAEGRSALDPAVVDLLVGVAAADPPRPSVARAS
jgi:DNA-binding SARP family transcriptional activator/DNA-binding NarL/FixJ family response regulator